MPFSRLAAVLAPAVLIAACTGGPSPSADPGEAPGVLVVGRADAEIFTIAPDGSNRTDLVEEQSGLVAIQPTWSPDGSRLVWTEVDHMSEVPRPEIVTARPDGSEVQRTSAPLAPFYYFWSPDGEEIAFLGTGRQGRVDLGLLDGEVKNLGGAQPYYFAWDPAGGRLLTHTNLETVAVLSTEGVITVLESTRARFQAPQWSTDGTQLVYAIGSPPPTGGTRAGAWQSDEQAIVVARPDGEIVQRIDTFAGVAAFELSPDGRVLAHSATLDRAAFNFGPLNVTDLESGEETSISQEPVLAFQWSPDGSSLLYLAAAEGVDHPSFRWTVWDGRTSIQYEQVTPTTSFATAYLPFWDQYSRSHTLWAPDGSAFAYTGQDEEGEGAVWIQSLDAEQAPRRVATGDVVFWSPAGG